MITVEVKPGWKKGTRITFQEKGDSHPGRIPADVVFVISEKPHSQFRRDGNDLVTTYRLPLADALCGCALSLTALDGRPLRLSVTDVVQLGSERVLPGEGMPLSKEPTKRGNLRVKFEVTFPQSLTDAQKALLRQALPAQ